MLILRPATIRACLALGLTAVLGACARTEQHTVYDFAKSFPVAVVQVETESGDFAAAPEVGSIDRGDPPLTVARESVRAAEGLVIGEPSAVVEDEKSRLLLPLRSRVDYFVWAPSESVLVLDRIEAWGSSPALEAARLEVDLRTDEPGGETRFELQPSSGWRRRLRLPLPDSICERPLRISFYARPGPAAGGGEAGLSLHAPSLMGAGPDAARGGEEPVSRPPGDPSDAETPRPDILVYLIDTLRADHLGVYGYPLPTSPNLDALARDGILFANAIAQSSWTRASVASIFTGLHPRSHAVNRRADKLSAKSLTLPLLLRASGFQTAGFTTNANVAASFGFDLGFDSYAHLGEQKTAELHQLSDALNRAAFSWLERRDPERPFFLYLHATDPHAPYTPRSPFRERFAGERVYPQITSPRDFAGHDDPARYPDARALDLTRLSQELRALYDAEIAFNDHHFGELLRWLKQRDLYHRSMIVLLSDHGEEFHEHGRWEHNKSLYQEQLAVPLIIKLPGQARAGTTVDAIAQHVDVLPSILEYLGLPIPPEVQGRSLWPLLETQRGTQTKPARAVSYLELDGRRMESMIANGPKLIRYLQARRTTPALEYFDLEGDPGEREDLARSRPVMAGYLLSLLEEAALDQRKLLVSEEAIIDSETADRLRALGYIR